MIHTIKGFSIVNEAEVDVFLEFSCCLYDPIDVGSLISGSFDFSKPSLYIWEFSIHVLLKPSLKDFEHNLTSMWNELNCVVIWTFFGIAFFGIGIKTDLFQICGYVLHHFNAHFSFYVILLITYHLLFILYLF